MLIACALNLVAGEKIHPPSETELEDLTGEALPYPVKSVIWQAKEPPKTNLFIYAVQPKIFRPEFLKSLAEFLGVHGEMQTMPASMVLDAPGYWIKEPNPTNQSSWKSVAFSERSGSIGFGSGEDNHKWDLKNHKPLAHGVPDEKEALQRTLALLPMLGITTNDLEHLPDGRLKYGCNTDGTWYNDRYDNGARKRYIRQINIELWQKIQDGASVLSIGGGGMLRAGYISEGHLAELEMTFRNVKPIGSALPKTSKELTRMLKRGDGRSFHSLVPSSLTITNCILVYPEANSATKQDFLWPFYALSAVSVQDGETNSFYIYEPLNPQTK
ncbi:MAG: hypothetical protein ACREC8_10610 [Limisphaerales bacterium]